MISPNPPHRDHAYFILHGLLDLAARPHSLPHPQASIATAWWWVTWTEDGKGGWKMGMCSVAGPQQCSFHPRISLLLWRLCSDNLFHGPHCPAAQVTFPRLL